MKLIGVLTWYDEDPAWLAATTASMCRAGCEHILALDGAYAAFPEARAWSHPDQHVAILEVARAMNAGCTLHTPPGPWQGGEIEKRTTGFQLAETFTTEEDWLVLMDADQVILESEGLRDALAATDLDVAEPRFVDPGTDLGFPVRCVFRALRGIHLRDNHATYMAADGRRLAMQPPMVEALPLPMMMVEHRTASRALARKQRQQNYYERRDRLGLEHEAIVAC
jgi:hypothetical protein